MKIWIALRCLLESKVTRVEASFAMTPLEKLTRGMKESVNGFNIPANVTVSDTVLLSFVDLSLLTLSLIVFYSKAI